MDKVLTSESILWFGKHKDKTIAEVLKKNPKYILWIQENKIQNITFDDSVVIPRIRRYSSLDSDNYGYKYDDLDREYASQRRDEYPSEPWGSDGDYYPCGCDIYGFG